MPIDGATEVGQGKDKTDFRTGQTGSHGCSTVTEPYYVSGAGGGWGDTATAHLGPAYGPHCPHTHHTVTLFSEQHHLA